MATLRGRRALVTGGNRGIGPGGRIINIGSCNAERVPFPGRSVYAMSKAALVDLVKGLARDLGTRGISINNVQPGPVATDMNPADGPFAEMLHKQVALPRHAEGPRSRRWSPISRGPTPAS